MNIQQFKDEYVDHESPGPLETPCWIHKNKPHISGYVQMSIDGERIYAHVFAKRIERDIPEGFECDHICENKGCCNPAHIDVQQRRWHKHRHAAKITHCPQGHEYTEENTKIIERMTKSGWKTTRECIACINARFKIINANRRHTAQYKSKQLEYYAKYRAANRSKINEKQLAKYHAAQAALRDQANRPGLNK